MRQNENLQEKITNLGFWGFGAQNCVNDPEMTKK